MKILIGAFTALVLTVLQMSTATAQPPGYKQMCEADPMSQPCRPLAYEEVPYNDKLIFDLRDAARQTAFDVPYKADEKEHWRVPERGNEDDCDGRAFYIIELMVRKGYSRGAFRVAVVRQRYNDPQLHLVVLVFSDQQVLMADANSTRDRRTGRVNRGRVAEFHNFPIAQFLSMQTHDCIWDFGCTWRSARILDEYPYN